MVETLGALHGEVSNQAGSDEEGERIEELVHLGSNADSTSVDFIF